MEKDGYADLRVSYHSRTQNKTYEKWKTEVEDIKAKNGETVTYTYTKDGTDADNITLEFDAHGKNSDKYHLNVEFSEIRRKFHVFFGNNSCNPFHVVL